MAGDSQNKGLPFQPFHVPRSHTGGSAWLLSGAFLACGVALPGLCLAWRWKQVSQACALTADELAAIQPQCRTYLVHQHNM